VFISPDLQFEVTIQSCYLTRPTVLSHYSQFFLSHQTYHFKSLFTIFISADLQFEVTVHSFYLITTTAISHYSQLYLITITALSHYSQILSLHNHRLKSLFTVFFSHHNYSYKSLFTFFISQDLQFEATIHMFYLITTTVIRHC